MAKEKSFTQSKKFIFGLIGILLLTGLGIVAFFTQSVGMALTTVLIAVVIVIGFIVVGVTLGQTILDKYVRVAEIATNKFSNDDDDKEEKKDDKETNQ